jgi:hypothetical protein
VVVVAVVVIVRTDLISETETVPVMVLVIVHMDLKIRSALVLVPVGKVAVYVVLARIVNLVNIASVGTVSSRVLKLKFLSVRMANGAKVSWSPGLGICFALAKIHLLYKQCCAMLLTRW